MLFHSLTYQKNSQLVKPYEEALFPAVMPLIGLSIHILVQSILANNTTIKKQPISKPSYFSRLLVQWQSCPLSWRALPFSIGCWNIAQDFLTCRLSCHAAITCD
ncbi:hypothetical protein PoMZ_07859 [Pyricularia oryzae]|uniref:Uncharacterized protein n=1 Tax=Pyricularia oryzae TaxID=318829 RepID=A0A4P7NG59_PYROR|nr:hypothetical protein PoMZ_07859 [Pyricularia oryzae]